jgi:hypothetical protein
VGIPLLYFGWVSSGFTITEALFMNNFVSLEKLVGSKRRILIFSTLLIGLGYLTLGLTANPILVIIAATICASLSFGRQVLSINYMNKFISTENRATLLSTVSMGRMFGIMLLNPLMGWLAEQSLIWVLIGLGIVGIILGLINPIKEADLIN